MPRPFALITGASSGVGAELATNLINEYDLVLVARNQQKLQEVKKRCLQQFSNGLVDIIAADLSNFAGLEQIKQTPRNIRLLINCAGIGFVGEAKDLPLEKTRQTIDVNVWAPIELTKFFANELIKNQQSGKILNIASLAAFGAIPYFATYAASKSFLVSYSEALSFELRPHGIEVKTLCPGGIYTDFFKPAGISDDMIKKNAFFMQSVEEVVRDAIRLIRGKNHFKIPGQKNKILYLMMKFLPRALSTKISGFTYKEAIDQKQ